MVGWHTQRYDGKCWDLVVHLDYSISSGPFLTMKFDQDHGHGPGPGPELNNSFTFLIKNQMNQTCYASDTISVLNLSILNKLELFVEL